MLKSLQYLGLIECWTEIIIKKGNHFLRICCKEKEIHMKTAEVKLDYIGLIDCWNNRSLLFYRKGNLNLSLHYIILRWGENLMCLKIRSLQQKEDVLRICVAWKKEEKRRKEKKKKSWVSINVCVYSIVTSDETAVFFFTCGLYSMLSHIDM